MIDPPKPPAPDPARTAYDEGLASDYERATARQHEDARRKQRQEEDRQRAADAVLRSQHRVVPPRAPIPMLQKVVIFGLECDVDLEAQYNPKEIQIEKALEWKASANKKGDKPDLEFGATKPRSMSMELMFDTYEQGIDVQVYVRKLVLLTSVMDPNGDEMRKRPTLVQVRWGNPDLPIFEGVIESVSTKLTMFLPSGTPVRATCNVKMMEAQRSFQAGRKGIPPGPATRW